MLADFAKMHRVTIHFEALAIYDVCLVWIVTFVRFKGKTDDVVHLRNTGGLVLLSEKNVPSETGQKSF